MLTHATEALHGVSHRLPHDQQTAALKRFLKIETERMRIRHRFGLPGGDIVAGISYLVDLVVCHAGQIAAARIGSDFDLARGGCAVIALGGYGRQELAPFSDIDLLFLQTGKYSKAIKLFTEQVLYLLWDSGFSVGHSLRSLGECESMAKNDLHSFTALSEARLVTGSQPLFQQFTKQLDHAVYKNHKSVESFLKEMHQELGARHLKFGGSACVQEPNIKEGVGGLRDVHTVFWLGRASYGQRGLDDLCAANNISGTEYVAMRRGYDFLMRVRNEAHFAAGRKADLLTLDFQPSIAKSLRYRLKGGLLASEVFMRDYYRNAHDLHRACASFFARAFAALPQKGRVTLSVARKSQPRRYEVQQGKLSLSQIDVNSVKTLKKTTGVNLSEELREAIRLYLSGDHNPFRSHPLALLECFSVAQTEQFDLSEDLRQAIQSSLALVNKPFRNRPEVGNAFLEMLDRRGRVAAVLRLMHDTGFLGRLMPEFGRITFLVQHDLYHKYTIDEHTIKAIEALDLIATGRDSRLARYSKVFGEIGNAAPLYLALLLHDIGKGTGGGHVAKGTEIAENVCQRFRLTEIDKETVLFLVKEHLLMSNLSQRRDISEPGLVSEFARVVGSAERLNLLLLLTFADTFAVAPGIWTEWKDALLWELYSRARLHLVGSEPVGWDDNRASFLKQRVIEELHPDILPTDIERHLAMPPERYLRSADASKIAREIRLIEQLDSATAILMDWQTAGKHCSELTICAHDRVGLFAAIAGALTAQGVNILSADLYTREDGIVIDTFKLCDAVNHQSIAENKQPLIEDKLRASIEAKYDVAAAIEKWRQQSPRRLRRHNPREKSPAVEFDSESSMTGTIIEVRANDEVGLAYKLANALSALGLNITFAKIATEKSQALDVFYVTDADGNKLSPSAMRSVEESLLRVVGRTQIAETA